MEFTKAVIRPFQDLKTFLIGVLFAAIPIANLLAVGYYVETLKETTKKNFEQLKWGNYKKLFLAGLSVLGINLIYGVGLAIVLVVLLIALLGLSALSELVTAIATSDASAIEYLFYSMPYAFMIAIFLTGILVAGFTYYLFGAIANFATTGKFKAAFAFKDIKEKILTRAFLKAWLVGAFYKLGVTLAAGVPGLIEPRVLPYVFGAIASFMIGNATYTLIGEARSAKQNV